CENNKQIAVLNETKCNQRITDLKSEILKIMTVEEYNDRIYDLRSKWPYTVDNLLKIVSGKDYLLPLLEFRFHKFTTDDKVRMKRKTLRLRLAKLCDTSELTSITSYF